MRPDIAERLYNLMYLLSRHVLSWFMAIASQYGVFLPERDYVTFGSLLSQFRLSSVVCRLSVCLSVTLVHPTHGVEPFGKISSPLCTLAIL